VLEEGACADLSIASSASLRNRVTANHLFGGYRSKIASPDSTTGMENKHTLRSTHPTNKSRDSYRIPPSQDRCLRNPKRQTPLRAPDHLANPIAGRAAVGDTSSSLRLDSPGTPGLDSTKMAGRGIPTWGIDSISNVVSLRGESEGDRAREKVYP
jgi:hypothetical protein